MELYHKKKTGCEHYNRNLSNSKNFPTEQQHTVTSTEYIIHLAGICDIY